MSWTLSSLSLNLCLFVYLFVWLDALRSSQRNSNVHVGALPTFYWILYPVLGCHYTQNVLHKYNHPRKNNMA